MAEVTVSQFAEVLKVPVDRLLAQLDQAGIKVSGPNARITDDAKLELLTHLRRTHGSEDAGGDGAPRKITLKRKTQSELKLASTQGRARTSTLTVRARPCVLASFNSLWVLRLSVILRGAPSPPASSLPCVRRRCVRSSSFASSVMRALGPDTLMPAWSSCASSRSTGTFSTSANCETVTSAISFASSSPSVTRLEPRCARRHDQLRGFLGGQPLDIGKLIDRLLGKILARAHAAPRERQRQVGAHALEQQQIIRRHRLSERLLARDRLGEQHIARAVAQFLDDVRVELLDRRELRLRHVGDLLDGGEALLREDGRHVLVHIQLLHEIRHQLLRLGLTLGLGV